MKAITAWKFFCLSFLLLLVSCHTTESLEKVKVSISDAEGKPIAHFQAEVASNESTRQIGLMYRKQLADTDSMLFVFPDEKPRSFWMKNTYVELDMLYFNSQDELVSIVERAVPLSETARVSKLPAKYVLEIRGGLSAKLGIRPGNKMTIEGNFAAPR